ncbi:MAG: methylmalonyl-CoA mutase, partial [Bdellovibrionales bacterium]|nr:methylmalonyl-CoA mutase [Bdellovibrionales bacterium]
MANGLTYVEAAVRRGLDIDLFAPRVAFFFNGHSDFFEEVAKFRAARRLWATLLRERFKPKNSRSEILRFHTQTAGSSLTAQQPLNNVVRTTMQALSAVLGGTQSLHTNGFDEALCLPSQESALLALRTQQIIAAESGVVSTVDPLAGSYFVEHLTDEIEVRVRQQLEVIDSLGGVVRAIEQGYPQGEIQRSAYEFQKEVESEQRQIVGVNCYQDSTPFEPPESVADSLAERSQISALREIKNKRSSDAVSKSTASIKTAAESG